MQWVVGRIVLIMTIGDNVGDRLHGLCTFPNIVINMNIGEKNCKKSGEKEWT